MTPSLNRHIPLNISKAQESTFYNNDVYKDEQNPTDSSSKKLESKDLFSAQNPSNTLNSSQCNSEINAHISTSEPSSTSETSCEPQLAQNEQRSLDQCVQELLTKAENGDNDAQFDMGYYFFNQNDLINAFYWLNESRKQGNSNARDFIEQMIEQGYNLQEKEEEALQKAFAESIYIDETQKQHAELEAAIKFSRELYLDQHGKDEILSKNNQE